MKNEVLDPEMVAQHHTPAIHWVMMSIPSGNNPYGGFSGDYAITWGMMEEGATLRVSVQYDSYGEWEDQVCMEGVGRTRSVTVPVLTRRCDHFRLRFDGTGVCRLFSIAKIIEYGSDENHD